MAKIGKTAAALRIFGDDLKPEEISILLGATPTRSALKGQIKRSKSGHERVERSGSWLMAADDASPGDLNGQIKAILSSLTMNLSTWNGISKNYKCDVFCGLFMEVDDEGLGLSFEVMGMMASRKLRLEICIYGATTD